SRVALGCMAAVLFLLMFAPAVLGAGAIYRMTALFIYVILAVIDIERDQRGARLPLDQPVEVDEQMGEFGDDPHADRELAALQA
ncbi:hypothetical protein ACC710_37235, partial [Rhizobium ruizarguesonis]